MEPSRADSQTFAASLAPRGMASAQSSTGHIQNREGRSPQPQPNSPDSDHLVRYPLAILVTLPRHVKPLSGTFDQAAEVRYGNNEPHARLRHRMKSRSSPVRSFSPRPKKRFGQHFLVSPTILMGILRLAELTPDDVVLEVGAGTGTLTEALAGRVRRLLALELDRDLIVPLRQRFADRPHVEIIHADALTFDLAQLPKPIKVVANLPYGTAVAILTRLLTACTGLDSAVVMVQREVAARLYAMPGTKSYGSLTLLTQWYARAEKGFNVPPSAFSPPPKVSSTVVKIIPRPAPPVAVGDKALLFRVIHAAFAQRRKMLVNALRHAFQSFEPATLRQILEHAGITPTRRGETLTLHEFAHLADAMRPFIG
jgi:16S rRNA (adenine1518-N6/adenine1519-N6)-dimethyltransferase